MTWDSPPRRWWSRRSASLTATISVAFLAIAFGGCIAHDEVPMDIEDPPECAVYPDRADLQDKWSTQATTEKEGYDAVTFGVSTYGMNSWEDPDGTPEDYVNWTKYPKDLRPEILQDVVCWVLGRLEAGWTRPFSTGAVTAHHIAKAALDDVRAEHWSQTGVWLEEDCCYLWFEGAYYAVGWTGFTKTWPDGSTSTSPRS